MLAAFILKTLNHLSTQTSKFSFPSTWFRSMSGIAFTCSLVFSLGLSGSVFGQYLDNSVIWTKNGLSSTAGQNCAGETYVFNNSGDNMISPSVSNPETLSFQRKRSGNTTAWSCKVQISTDLGFTIFTDVVTVSTITGNCESISIDLSTYPGVRRIKIIDTRASGTHERSISDVTVTCMSSYTVDYDGNGNDSGTAPTDASSPYTSGSTVAVLGNTGSLGKTGNTFAGWTVASDGSGTVLNAGSTFAITANTILYAKWTPTSGSNVTFNANGGTGSMSTQNASSPTNLSSNTFTRTGYAFTGWNTASNGSGISYTNNQSYDFSADLTLFAQWSATNNTLSFNANGGTGTMASQTIATDATTTLNSNAFSRAGYTFAGWATSAGGAVAFANEASYTMGISDATLFAVWNANTYTVTFNGNGSDGGSMASQNYVTGTTANLTANAFTRTGYTFSGWNTSADGLGTSYANSASYTMGTANVTLFAQWVVYVGPCMSTTFPTTALPSGWSGTSVNATTAAHYQSAPNTRQITGSTDLITASINTPSSIKFYVDASSSGGQIGTLAYRIGSGSWTSIGTFTASTAGVVEEFDLTSSPNLTTQDNVSFRFTSNSNSIYIDDIEIFCAPATPTLNVSVTSLTNLNYTVGFGPSAVQTFNLTGTNLDGSDVDLVLANTDFEISSNNSTFSNSINLPAYSGASQPIYVRLKSGLTVNSYSDVIMIAGGGVALIDEPEVSVSGIVNAVITPVITSSLTQTVEYGSSVSYQITANNTPTSFGAINLPAGLSINASGLISGTVTANVGTVNTTITATNSAGTDSKTLVWTITPKALTVSGLTGSNKVYDGNTTATLSGTGTLVGVVGADVVSISGTPSATFVNATVGNNKSITVSGYTLSGAQAGNYTLTQPTGITANITPKALTVTGATAQDKVYNGTNVANITGATLVGVVGLDVVTISGGGTFASADAGTGIAVSSNLTLAGAQAANYTLTQPTGLSANITKADPVFTTSPISLTIGGTYSLPGSNISSTSNGALSYTISSGGNATLAGTTITGAVVGSETLTVNQAASANYNAGSTTVAVNVTTINYVNGDYRTTGSGTWVSNSVSPAIWERFDGSSWNTSNSPNFNTSNTVYIQNGHTITSGGSFGNSVRMNIQDGGVFTQNHSGTFASLEIKEGGKINVNASLTIAIGGNFTVENNAEVIVNFAFGNPETSIWNGIEMFYPASSFVFVDWDGADDIIIPSNTAISTNTFNGYTAAFGNVIFDFASNLGDSDDLIVLESGTNINLAHGDLIFRTNDNALATIRISTTGTVTSGIGGDFIVEDSYLSSQVINFKTSGNLSFTINGSMNLDAATTRLYSGSAATGSVVTILEDLNIYSSAVLEFNSSVSSTPSSTLNLHGDLYVVGSGLLQNSNTGNLGVFNFVGNGDGLTANTTQTIDVASTSSNENRNIQFNVKPNSYVRLINRNFELGANSSLKIEAEGTFDFGFNGSTPLQVVVSGTQTGTSFVSETNSILKVTSLDGINNAPSNVGNVLTHSRTYQTLGDFHFIGKVNQKTGNGVPTDIRNLYINHEGASNNDYVTFTNFSKNVHNILTMTKGNIVATRDSMLILGSSLTERGFLHYNNGFVLGVMRRWFVSTNDSDTTGLFPMGQDVSGLKNRFARVYYNVAPTHGGHLTVEFISTILTGTGFPIPAANTGGFNQDVINPGSPGYWRMDNETDKLDDGSHTISLTGEGFPTITNINDVTIIKRVGGGDWFCPGTHVFVTGTAAMPTLTRTNVVGWSNYGFGGGTATPLPVELISFHTDCQESSADIRWSTASELNSYQYVLENSRDLNNWFEVTTMSAAGNSNTQLDYYYSDQSPFQGISYYRLRQIDFNGTEKIYGPISVSCNEVEEQIEVYPNPAKHEFTVAIQLTENKPATTIQLMDVSGKIIHTLVKDLKAGNSQILFNDLNLPDGAYLIQVISNESHFSPIRLVIAH